MIKLYLPTYLQDIVEFDEICKTEDVEFNNIKGQIGKVYTETVVSLATNYGLSKYEQLLGIVPQVNDTIQIRRFRILSVLQNKLPYTKRWLENKLNEIVGQGNYQYEINYDIYTLTIQISGLEPELMSEVQKTLRNSIPANMVLLIGGTPLTSSNINFAGGIHIATQYIIGSLY